MVVSHYLISGIEVVGLILGVFGVLFLAEGLFPSGANRLARAVFIGLMYGAAATVYQYFSPFVPLDLGFLSADFFKSPAGTFLLGALAGFIVALEVSFDSRSRASS